jgi:hypothetical protein
MHDSQHKKHGHGASKAGVQDTERRGGERHMFTAGAEVIELKSGARFSTRTTDLGPGGCFVDTTVPFPVGSKLRVTLQKGKTTFETPGTVVYSQHGLGMGIAFDELDAEQRLALAEWITGVSTERQNSHHDAPHAAKGSAQTHRGQEFVTLVRLVQLMIGKGILTEAEGSSVLHDPLL